MSPLVPDENGNEVEITNVFICVSCGHETLDYQALRDHVDQNAGHFYVSAYR